MGASTSLSAFTRYWMDEWTGINKILLVYCKGRADSRFAPSQWETALLCNAVSQWLGASLESALKGLWEEDCATLNDEQEAAWAESPAGWVCHMFAVLSSVSYRAWLHHTQWWPSDSLSSEIYGGDFKCAILQHVLMMDDLEHSQWNCLGWIS